MLEDYTRYLLNIRNNLIQCGVNISVDTPKEYIDVCELQQVLDDVLYYYKILAISNSSDKLEDFFIRFSTTFKEYLRNEAHKEFLDFWFDYKQLSCGVALLSKLRKELADLGGDCDVDSDCDEEKTHYELENTKVSESTEDLKDCRTIADDLSSDDVEDIFSGILEDDLSDEESTPEGNESESGDSYSDVEEVSDGVMLDEDCDLPSDDTVNVSSGVMLDEDEDFTESKSDTKDVNNAVEEVPDGVMLEDLIREDSEMSKTDEGILTDENGIELEEDTSDEEENNFFDEEQIETDENGFELMEEPESSDEDEYYDDEQIETDENGFELMEEPESSDEDEYEDGYNDDVETDENGFELVEESAPDGFYLGDEDIPKEDDFDMPEEDDTSEDTSEGKSLDDSNEVVEKEEKDILDRWQGEVSKIINIGYHHFKNSEKRLKSK